MPTLTIVTAVDQKFFRTTCQFLRSCLGNQLHKSYSILLYDLGMEERQRDFIEKTYIQPYGLELETFQFNLYPPFIQIHSDSMSMSDYKQNVTSNSGAYAWKPVIIWDVLEKTKGMVLWLDSGTVVLGPLQEIESCIRHDGLFTPIAGKGLIQERTHPNTLGILGAHNSDKKKQFRSGGVCGFNLQFSWVRELVLEWRRFSLIEACIAPMDANDSNHRYDQSILSLLVYRYEREQGLTLTNSEIDISSTDPIACLSTRNKVSNSIPLWCDPLVRLYFTVKRYFDIWILKFKVKIGVKI